MEEYEAKPEPEVEPVKSKYKNGNYQVYKQKTEPVKRICKKCGVQFDQPKKNQFSAGQYFEYCPDCRVKRDRLRRKNTNCSYCGKILPKFRKDQCRLPFCNESCQIQFIIHEGQKRWAKYGANLKSKEVKA
jgi:hypothetical protein